MPRNVPTSPKITVSADRLFFRSGTVDVNVSIFPAIDIKYVTELSEVIGRWFDHHGIGADNEDRLTTVVTDPAFGMAIGTGTVKTHSRDKCKESPACPVHSPSNHHMRDWPTVWRADTQVLERICAHNIGHPDPDQIYYWQKIGAMHRTTHGCDGCCTGQDRSDDVS